MSVFTPDALSGHSSRRPHLLMLACSMLLLLQLKPNYAKTTCSQEPSAQRPRTCNIQSDSTAAPARNRQRDHRMMSERNEYQGTPTIKESTHETARGRTCSHANEMASALTSRLVKMFCFFAFMLQSKAHMQTRRVSGLVKHHHRS
jgi:hypothetical protein